jgi:hypothetical protein
MAVALTLLVATLLCPPSPHVSLMDIHADWYVRPKVAVPAPEALVSTTGTVPDRREGERANLTVGHATWYRWTSGQAAAGPRLRKALGRGWRGTNVLVCAKSSRDCVEVTLTDWCACKDRRVIDLDDDDFAQLAPTWRGYVEVTVRRA